MTSEKALIAIVEDDEEISRLVSDLLRQEGYAVEAAASGTELDGVLARMRPDLVVLDLTIPNGLGGVRTMERLRQLDPNVLAIVSSGYSDDPVMAKPAAYGFSAVLPKPYEPADLLRLVKSVLNARGMIGEKKA
jgi:CheY-like chemotaxis protein